MKTKEILAHVYDLAIDGQFENSDVIARRIRMLGTPDSELSTIIQAIFQLGWDTGFEDADESK